jgi:hypothetical protein
VDTTREVLDAGGRNRPNLLPILNLRASHQETKSKTIRLIMLYSRGESINPKQMPLPS